jgi:hypothetical protein
VAHSDGHPGPDETRNRVERAGQLWGDGDLTNHTWCGIQQPIDRLAVGVAKQLAVVSPLAPGRQERAFDADANEARVAIHRHACSVDRRHDALDRTRDERRNGPGRAVRAHRRQCIECLVDPVLVVGATCAVAVNVDEARRDVPPEASIDRSASGGVSSGEASAA